MKTSASTLPTDRALFLGFLLGVVGGGLTYPRALTLEVVVEHLQLFSVTLY